MGGKVEADDLISTAKWKDGRGDGGEHIVGESERTETIHQTQKSFPENRPVQEIHISKNDDPSWSFYGGWCEQRTIKAIHYRGYLCCLNPADASGEEDELEDGKWRDDG